MVQLGVLDPRSVDRLPRRRSVRAERSTASLTFSWLNQSCVWNWIHAAASRLSVVAGMKLLRTMNFSLMARGFGVQSSASVGRGQLSRGKLRPNRMPAQPIRGRSSELNLPSELRASRNRSSASASPWRPCAAGSA